MFEKELSAKLSKYNNKGEFTFHHDDDFNKVCNAPKNEGGVYIVSSVSPKSEHVIYIGASGKMLQNGTFKVRNGGMRYRIVNGTTTDVSGKIIRRKKLWKENMMNQHITTIKIRWWVTFNAQNHDISTCVEGKLIQEYFNKYRKLPEWNKTY